MSFWASQSIPLSERTFNAWKNAGAKFFTPGRDNEYITRIVNQPEREEEFFINLGRVDLAALEDHQYGLPVWNNGPDVVWPLNTPTRTRELFHDLMAPQTGESEYIWIKEAGWGGRGKEKARTSDVTLSELPYWEDHVEGDEYRIITVGNLRVQQFVKEGEVGAFTYTWLPMSNLPTSAKELIKRASERLPRRSVVGWDVLVDEAGATLIEGNSTPGVNNDTAARIVDSIRSLERAYQPITPGADDHSDRTNPTTGDEEHATI